MAKIYGRDFTQVAERAARYGNKHGNSLERAEDFIRRAGWIRSTFGVEHVAVADRELAYINTGDTYETTIGQEGAEPLIVTTWGDWYEGAEQDYHEDNGTIACAYCGHYTPRDDSIDWRDNVCEGCGHHVDGSR